MPPPPPFTPGGPVALLGHRGCGVTGPRPSGRLRENSLASFRRALGHGLSGVETDVRQTADGHLVLHHDDRIGPPDDSRPFSGLTRTELCRLLGFRPPLLGAALADLSGRSAVINLEIKECGFDRSGDRAFVARLAAALAASGCRRPVLLSTFSPRLLELLAGLRGPRVKTGFLTDRGATTSQPYDVYLPFLPMVHTHPGLLVRQLAVIPWAGEGTGFSDGDAAACARLPLAGLILDRAWRAIPALARAGISTLPPPDAGRPD